MDDEDSFSAEYSQVQRLALENKNNKKNRLFSLGRIPFLNRVYCETVKTTNV